MTEHDAHEPGSPFPVGGWFAGHDLPDLAQIPRARWRAALAPLSPMARDWCLRQQPFRIFEGAYELVWELNAEDRRRRRAMRKAADGTDAVPAPASGGGHRRVRQVNARLYDRDYHRLQTAARLLGARPAELARTFIVRGTARVLEEHESPRPRPKP